jgi:hypothetical protein
MSSTTTTTTNSKPTSSPYPPDSFEVTKHPSLDFFNSHSPSDVLAPHPDLFESELDSSLAAFDEFQFQLFTVDSNDAYSFLRSDTPTCGPPSTLTVSSESAYDSLSSHSDSFYNYPHSSYTHSNISFPLDLDMDFQQVRIDNNVTDYAPQSVVPSTADPNSFGTLPPTPPHSPPLHGTKNYGSLSDYGPSPRINISSTDYYSPFGFNADPMGQATTVQPSRLSHIPVVSSLSIARPSSDDGFKGDPRKKFKCTVCPRGKLTFSSII